MCRKLRMKFMRLGDRPWGLRENGENQGQGCGAVHLASADKPWGLVETVFRRPSHQMTNGAKKKVQEHTFPRWVPGQPGKARTGHSALPFYTWQPLYEAQWATKKAKSWVLLNQPLEHYWECLHSEASGMRPALKSECTQSPCCQSINKISSYTPAAKGIKTRRLCQPQSKSALSSSPSSDGSTLFWYSE